MVQHFFYDLTQIEDVASQIVSLLQDKPIWAVYGEIGAGKTTLVKGLAKQLKVVDHVTSPTFSIVNEYLTQDNQVIYHFDMYRIESLEELYDIGYEEYLYSGSKCIIEWPEKMGDLLPTDAVKIEIELTETGRKISLHY